MTEKLLVIGACGFVGSNFIRKAFYNKYPYNIVGIDRISYENSIGNIYQHPKYKFYLNDFSDSHALKLILEFEKPDKILFVAQPIINYENEFYKDNLKSFFDVLSKSEKKCQLLYLTNEPQASVVYNEYTKSNLNYSFCFTPYLFGPRQNYFSFLPVCLNAFYNKNKIFTNSDSENWMFIDDLCSAINYLFQDWEKNRNCLLQSNWNFSPSEMAKEIGIILNDLSWFSPDQIVGTDKNNNNLNVISWPAQEKFKTCLQKTIDWYEKNSWFLKKNILLK